MFGRNKNSNETAEKTTGSVRADSPIESEEKIKPHHNEQHTQYTAPKGRPTPSRKQQQRARRQPLVPTDRKAAKEADKQAIREQRVREQQAMQTGDERFLPARDKGAQRRFIRDYVDARYNVGDYIMIAIVLIFVIGLFSHSLQAISVILMWSAILLWALDTWFMWRKLKKKIIKKFGAVEPGSAMYATNRVLMIRRFRLPKPQVKRGQFPS